METKPASHSYITIAAIASLAFITACVAHEAVGHGGVCLALGHRIILLTSVYFRCSQGSPLTDAGGPLMNLAVGISFYALLRARAKISPQLRLFIVLAMAFNLFWGAGYFVFSAVTNRGDCAYVLQSLAPEPQWLWRCGMGLLGAFLYIRSMRLVASRSLGRTPLLVSYLSAGVVSCAAVLFFKGPILPALREAAQEGFGAGLGLLILARSSYAGEKTSAPSAPIGRSNGWLLVATVIIVAFVATLGKGLSFNA